METKELQDALTGVKSAFEEFKKANDERLALVEKNQGTAELEAKLAKIEQDMEAKEQALNDEVLALKRQRSVVTDENGNEVNMDAKAQDWANLIAQQKGRSPVEFDAEKMVERKEAFAKYAREGKEGLEPSEIKALSVGSDSDGGYFINPDMSGRIVQKVFESSPVRAYASVQVISSASLKGLYDDDEASTFWEGESESVSEGDTPEVGEYEIVARTQRTLLKSTQELLEDSAINVEQWLAEKAADKIARGENAAFVTGNGVGRPFGFMSAAEGTGNRSQVEQIDTGANGAFAAAPNGGDALINALYSLKAPYRANATWFMNRATLKLVRKLKDSDGAYLWSPGVAAGQPATLLGYSVANFEDMADPATGSLSIAVGDLRQAYQIVDRMGISMLRDPYSYKPFVGFYFRKRVGGGLINGEALKFICFKA